MSNKRCVFCKLIFRSPTSIVAMCRIILNLEKADKKRSFEQQTNQIAAKQESEVEVIQKEKYEH